MGAFTDYVQKISRKPTDAEQMPFPAFTWVSPDAAVMEYVDRSIANKQNQAFESLNIRIGDSTTVMKTATEDQNDAEEFYSFMLTFTSNLFQLISDIMWFEGVLRWGDEYVHPTIIPPTDFTMRSLSALTNEYATAVEKNLPDDVVNKIEREFVSQRTNGDEIALRKLSVVQQLDALHNKSAQMVSVVAGYIPAWKIVLHYMISSFLDEKMRGDKDYLNKDLVVIKSDVEAMAQAIATGSKQSAEALLLMQQQRSQDQPGIEAPE
jgi:hypothetical protein